MYNHTAWNIILDLPLHKFFPNPFNCKHARLSPYNFFPQSTKKSKHYKQESFTCEDHCLGGNVITYQQCPGENVWYTWHPKMDTFKQIIVVLRSPGWAGGRDVVAVSTSLASYSNILGTFTVQVTMPNIVHTVGECPKVFLFSSTKNIPQALIWIKDSRDDLNDREFLLEKLKDVNRIE